MEELTRELLMDAGGHVEMKKARALHREGGVRAASYENGVLSGEVRVGGKFKKVSMEILSRTHMENHCKCLMVRRDGRVCAHVMAAGLEVIDPQAVPAVQPGEKPVEDHWPSLSPEGAPVQLQVMLPLKIEPAWERGQIMVGFGVLTAEGEGLLSALPQGSYALDLHDEELWRVLKEIFPGQPPGVMNLKPDEFLTVLEGLIGHPRVMFGKKEPARIHTRAEARVLSLKNGRVRVEPGSLGSWDFQDGKFAPLAAGLPQRYDSLWSSGYPVSEAEARAELGFLARWFEVSDRLWQSLPQEGVPEVVVHLEGSLRHLEARLEFFYNSVKARCEDGVPQLAGDSGLLTSPGHEAAVIDFFRSWGFEGPASGGRMALREREEILKFHAFAQLDPAWEVLRGDRFKAAAKQVVAVRPEWEWKDSGQDWFALETSFLAGDEILARDQVQRMLRMGSVEQVHGRGKIAVIDTDFIEEVTETLSDADPLQESPGVFKINARQAAFLKASARDFGIKVPTEDLIDLALPDALRPYQKEGVRWMYQLSEHEMGGILADDMGLGKTLQTLTFIKERGGSALVVCPSSLVSNWEAEVTKWVPDLSVACHVGPKRGEIPQTDLVITSYAILRIDAEKFHAREFEIAVVDEAQHIKNPEAKVSKAVHALHANHRFALSGTPVENSLQDLWSIMQFTLPGYLGQRKAFMERFEKPLRQSNDPALARRLARRLQPVILRRLKTEVAKDLPDRIEQVRYCDLTPKQAGIYRQILQESRAQVDAADGGKKRMIALTALLRLRQACCDLRLLPQLQVTDEEAGIKLQELEVMLEEAILGGHRILIFSQFVQLLQGIVPLLLERNWDHCYLDGSTTKRAEVVERFQNGSAPVFLISLKAGGTGLNLTAADTVIHLDPWWNPAVEAQATDRAHRIGQKKVVTSYKFITRGTVEEKILALQEEKKKIMTAALDSSAGLVPGFGDDELFGLFS